MTEYQKIINLYEGLLSTVPLLDPKYERNCLVVYKELYLLDSTGTEQFTNTPWMTLNIRYGGLNSIKGRVGEIISEAIAQSLYTTVVDVQDKQLQMCGIDYVIKHSGWRNPITVDVKSGCQTKTKGFYYHPDWLVSNKISTRIAVVDLTEHLHWYIDREALKLLSTEYSGRVPSNKIVLAGGIVSDLTTVQGYIV